jgi:N-acetylmuramoyl-L-alanine amidase
MMVFKKKFALILLGITLTSILATGCSNRKAEFNPGHTVPTSKAESANQLIKNNEVSSTFVTGIKPVITENVKPTEVKPTAERSEDRLPRADGDEITGSDSAKNNRINARLEDLIICIDAGHQKKANLNKEPVAPNSSELKVKDPGGASGVFTKTPEHELNLKVSKLLKRKLEDLGVKVVMTRESGDVNLGNVERAEIANRSNANLFIRIHADGSDNPNVKGISMLIPGSKYIKDENLLKQSKSAAQNILNSVVDSTGAKSRGIIERNDLTGFNWAKVPMILIEMGFLSNVNEDKLLNSTAYQNKIVDGIVNGIINEYSAES